MSLVNTGVTLATPMERQQRSKKNGNKNRRRRKNNKNQKQVTRKRINRPRSQAVVRSTYFHLSECSRLYARALVDPYNVESGQACIPDLIDIPSFKCLVIQRGTFNAGSQQVGFVICNPLACSSNQTGNIRSSLSTYAGVGAATIVTPTVGVQASAMTNMPYTDAQVVSGALLARTVGCGIRIRYTGTTLNMSGRLIPVRQDPFWGFPASGSLTVAQALSRPEIPSIACDRKWHSVTYLPAVGSLSATGGNDSYAYLPSGGTEAASTNSSFASLGWIVDGAVAGNGFEYEIYIHKEYITTDGTRVPLNTTASHSDAPGLSAVRDGIESSLPVTEGPSAYRNLMDYIQGIAPQDISHVSEYVKSGAQLAGTLRALTY
jgi:hypothetical protein